MVDLHTHSNKSDGSLAPAELILEAHKQGLSAIALCDHDTMDGIQEAQSASDSVGLRLIPGTEINITWPAGEFHLLGLGLQGPAPALENIFAQSVQNRNERNERIVDMLSKKGIDIDFDRVAAKAGGKIVGRIHLADVLIEMGLVRKRQEAFDRWLAKGNKLFVEKGGIPLEPAISAIHESGGLALLAHPMSLYVSRSKLGSYLAQWKDVGLDGIEAWHSGAKEGACKFLEKLAKELSLLISAGSDFHGKHRPECRLGYTAGRRKISPAYLESIDEALSKSRMSQGLSP